MREICRSMNLTQSLTGSLDIALQLTDDRLRGWVVNQLATMGCNPARIRSYPSPERLRAVLGEFRPDLVFAEFGPTGEGIDLIRKTKRFESSPNRCIGVLFVKDLVESRTAREDRNKVFDLILTPEVPPQDFRTLVLKLLVERTKRAEQKSMRPSSILFNDRSPSIQVAEQSIASAVEKFDLIHSLSYGITERHHAREEILRRFDHLMVEKKWEEAYAVSRQALPVLPEFQRRFDEVLKLAITNKKIEDLDELYRLFTSLDKRSDAMNRAMAAALVVAARYYLRRDQMIEAEDAYRKAIISSGAKPAIVREAVSRMLERGKLDTAKSFYARLPASVQGSDDAVTLEVWLLEADGQDLAAIGRGRMAYRAGVRDPDLSLALARALHRQGKVDFAEDLALEAAQRWPERLADFQPFMREWGTSLLTRPVKPETAAG